MAINFLYPDYEVVRNQDRCIGCRVCERQCANEVHSYNAELDCFIFDVYGYGHGCGMSQWGAIGYARNGWGYQDILTHYFIGTTITTY